MTTDNKVKETIGRAQVGNDAMTSDQPRQTIKKIWGEDGRDEEKEDKGAGLSTKMEDEGAGRKEDVYKGDRSEDDRNKESDRNKSDRNKNGDRNTDGGYKANGKIKE